MLRAPYLALCALAACSAMPSEPAGFTKASFQEENHPLAGVIWDVAAAREIPESELAHRLDQAQVVILGEIHDNPRHHERQARLVGEIAPSGLAFEMVPEASEEGIAVFLAQGGQPGEIGPAIGWDRLGWPDWQLYEPIFSAAPGASITGGGIARASVSDAIRNGAAAAFGSGAERYGLHIAPEAAEQAVLEDEMIASHCNKLPREAAKGMAEAQRLRDARFAAATERALELGGTQAVLITGNGHARTDRGVPAYLARSTPDLAVRSLGQIEVQQDLTDPQAYLTGESYDFVWFSARKDRPDPCASFN